MPADVTAWPSPQSWFVPLRGAMTQAMFVPSGRLVQVDVQA